MYIYIITNFYGIPRLHQIFYSINRPKSTSMHFHFLPRENGKQTNRINQSSADCPDPYPSWSVRLQAKGPCELENRRERLHAVIICPAHTIQSLHVFGIAPFTFIFMSGYVPGPMQSIYYFPSLSPPSPSKPLKLSQRIRYLYSIKRTDYSLLSTCKQNTPTIANFHPCSRCQALNRSAGYMYARQIATYVPSTCRYVASCLDSFRRFNFPRTNVNFRFHRC